MSIQDDIRRMRDVELDQYERAYRGAIGRGEMPQMVPYWSEALEWIAEEVRFRRVYRQEPTARATGRSAAAAFGATLEKAPF